MADGDPFLRYSTLLLSFPLLVAFHKLFLAVGFRVPPVFSSVWMSHTSFARPASFPLMKAEYMPSQPGFSQQSVLRTPQGIAPTVRTPCRPGRAAVPASE